MRFLFPLAIAAATSNALVVEKPSSNAITNRSPAEVDAQVDALVARHEAAVYIRDDSTDLDLGPPKKYDLSMYDLAPIEKRQLPLSHVYISAGASFVAAAASFSSLVTGCVGVDEATPISKTSCALSLVSTGISFMATVYHAYQGYRNVRAFLRNNNVELFGVGGAKRDEAGSVLTLSHAEYMEHFMRQAGVNGSHVGYHRRDGTEFDTPVYGFHNDGNEYHYTISSDEDGTVRHSISFAGNSKIEKRQGYEGVTVTGGLDIAMCQRTAGDQSDNPNDPATAYDYIYKDISCLLAGQDILSNNYVQSDLMDVDGDVSATISLVTWDGGSASQIGAHETCSNDPFYFSQSCVN